MTTKKKKKKTRRPSKADRQAESWILYIASSMEAINKTIQEMFEVVGQLNQHSSKQAMQLRTIRKRLIATQQAIKDMDTRIKTLEASRSRFDGVR